jgi:N-acetylglucosamine-6-phosphate deacetylase
MDAPERHAEHMKTVVSGILHGKRQQILIEDGVITAIGDLSPTEREGALSIDTDGFLYPGWIDIHIHGGGGADTMDGTEDAFRTIARTHAAHGTTGLYLTTLTESVERIGRVMRALPPGFRSGGARVLGFHLEGPFISPKKAGAHPVQHIQEPSLSLLEEWIRLSQGQVKILTIAPERPGTEALIRFARQQGIVVSMGHSAATYEEAMRGKEWGAQSITHLFNAMNGLHHREPGLAGLGLSDEHLFVELIADGFHVHSAVMKSLWRAVGCERLLLITDAMRAACMPDGEYEWGGQPVKVCGGKATLADGTLAGSTLTLDQAVRQLLDAGILPKEEIAQVTARNQARLLGLNKGVLAPGYDGDLIALDEQWQVTHTIVGGELVYRK